MSTIASARKALAAILKRHETVQATTAEREMMEHLERRNKLRVELQTGQSARKHEEQEHTENLAALHSMGEKYTHAERDSNAAVRDECTRLAKLVNNRRTCFTSSTAAEQLVANCLDVELQEQARIASENLQEAKRALQDARQQESTNWEAMSQAQRDLVETLGTVCRQFGPEGGRWRKTEDEHGVSVESVARYTDGGIHPENIAFFNQNLARPNRTIREGRAADFGIDRLTADVAALEEQLAVVHAAMVASDI